MNPSPLKHAFDQNEVMTVDKKNGKITFQLLLSEEYFLPEEWYISQMYEYFHFSLGLMTCLFLWSVWGRGRFGSGPSVISGCWRHTRTPNHTTPNLEIEDLVDLGRFFLNACHKSQKSSKRSPWLIKTFTLDQTFRHRSSWFVSDSQLLADPPSPSRYSNQNIEI